ncbi:4-hydroxybenzoate octaprenyltransferase [Dasania sp. GY-MA-18]|uniref:4-hydroxybenzoate octaprenyltransferase n=1 Tax=Dasania phycosphaerae TaxID=2950436 RepID=A0A9J6RJ84_9GAMM|nr:MULTISPECIES: 4-hydroxybenzoate octaprenyltransferase [Dasania]MCR8922022.1 4-hydroxybenzoate octaprenyltransferase [Dasania sp. GY-MA-18]MCZ0864450.1 4-hydroxybenzoate octaprenyltransferase [Dasania phycosphaerae]MCZ0868178.1 4-hydroxybenzoate octaprenyltransferase [Dasania phycosphaerae]
MTLAQLRSHAPDYLALIRFNKPVGTYLLLWPTLWALWLAAQGIPDLKLLIIFCLGTFLMRSAGCIINDYADRHIDGHVKRTAQRPMATGRISSKQALGFFVLLCLLSFVLVLFTNTLTIQLSFAALALASCYPFMKRYTHMPQLVLGMAFAMSIPMAFAAQTNSLPAILWLVYIAAVLWTIVYDTFYAMVDRDDDLRIGVKSTAILFGEDDKTITAILQACVIFTLCLVGQQFKLGAYFYLSLIIAAGFFIYQQQLIKLRERNNCFKAFLNNNWVGMAIFIGIALDYALPPLFAS